MENKDINNYNNKIKELEIEQLDIVFGSIFIVIWIFFLWNSFGLWSLFFWGILIVLYWKKLEHYFVLIFPTFEKSKKKIERYQTEILYRDPYRVKSCNAIAAFTATLLDIDSREILKKEAVFIRNLKQMWADISVLEAFNKLNYYRKTDFPPKDLKNWKLVLKNPLKVNILFSLYQIASLSGKYSRDVQIYLNQISVLLDINKTNTKYVKDHFIHFVTTDFLKVELPTENEKKEHAILQAYMVLGLNNTASEDEIYSAFNKIKTEFYPQIPIDKPSISIDKQFQPIKEAFELLIENVK